MSARTAAAAAPQRGGRPAASDLSQGVRLHNALRLLALMGARVGLDPAHGQLWVDLPAADQPEATRARVVQAEETRA